MRLSLLSCIAAVTALIFYFAAQSTLATTDSVASVSAIAELEDQTALLDASRADFDQQAAVLNTTIDDLNTQMQAQTTTLEAAVAERGDLQSQLDDAMQRLSTVEDEKVAFGAANDELTQQLATMTSTMESRDEAIGSEPDELVSQLDEALQRLGAIEAEKATLGAENVELIQQLEVLTTTVERQEAETVSERGELQSQLDEVMQRLSTIEAENATLIADKDELAQQITTLTATTESQETALRDAEASTDQLDRAIEDGRQETEALQVTIANLERDRDDLTRLLAESEANDIEPQPTTDSDLVAQQLQLQTELISEVESLEAEVTTLTSQATNLTDEVAQRDAVILGLLSRSETPSPSALDSCQERSDQVLSAMMISFEAGTTTIDLASTPQLDALAAVASECIEQGLSLEIEGHTGTGGGVASNLLLSDGRAKEVRNFLIDSGISTVAIRAIGFGGSEPIVDDGTPDGELQNERIVFDWEQN